MRAEPLYLAVGQAHKPNASKNPVAHQKAHTVEGARLAFTEITPENNDFALASRNLEGFFEIQDLPALEIRGQDRQTLV